MLSCMRARAFAAYRNRLLTPDQSEFFKTYGYVVLKGLMPPQYASKISEWATMLEQLPETKGKWMKYFELDQSTKQRILCRVENFMPFFKDIEECTLGFMTDITSDCLGEQSVIHKEKINFKLPGGGSFTAHQDQPAYVSFGLDTFATVLLPADPNTMQTGGLEFVPKRNQREILPQNSDGGVRTDLEARMYWQPVEVHPGDVVVFDSYAPHRSDVNRSKATRRNFYFTFNPLRQGALRDRYYEEKRNLFPPEIERDPNKDYSRGAKIFNVANPIK